MIQEPDHDGPREPGMLISSKVADLRVVAERHAEITRVATQLFIEKGFHKTTTRDIASALGWNMGTLYLYISSKEDVLYLVTDAVMRSTRQSLYETPLLSTASDNLCTAMEHYFRTIDARRGDYNFMYRESASLRVEHRKEMMKGEVQERDFFAAIIRQGMASGEFREVLPELLAHQIMMLAHMWPLKGWSLRRYLTFEEFLKRQTEFVFSYLLLRRQTPTPRRDTGRSSATTASDSPDTNY